MKRISTMKFSSLFLSMMLIVAMALCATGCGGKQETPMTGGTQGTPMTGGNQGTENSSNAGSSETVLGEGKTVFTFTVVDGSGNETVFEIHTDKTIVGDALLELKLIEGETSQYGLYVKKVNGITADYDVDGTYWAFYINGEYAMSGVDTTEIKAGDSYAMKVSK